MAGQVNFDSGEIARDGNTHRLQDQPLQILEELVQRPGEVVTREQLIARLWPKGVVEFDTGLNSAMRKLRIALGDDADTPRYIETLPRKGYRFIGRIEDDPRSPGFPPCPPSTYPRPLKPARSSDAGLRTGARPSSGWRWGSAASWPRWCWRWSPGKCPAGCSRSSGESKTLPTIVVLPLVDMSVDQSEQALCDGLTEELSNWLAHIPTLRVVARTSAFAFKGKNQDVRKIADDTRRHACARRQPAALRRSAAHHHAAHRGGRRDAHLVAILRPADRRHFPDRGTVSRAVAEALHLTLSAETAELWARREPQKMEALESTC